MIIKEFINDHANAKAKKIFKIRTYTRGFILFFGKTTDGQISRKVGYSNRQ
jgi:hypothetical protein